jgi:hypothetical protein
MSKTKSNLPAKRGSQELEQLPDWVKLGTNDGLENTTSQDLVLPRLAIVQNTSPEKDKKDPKYITGIEEGDVFNNVTRERYERPLRLTPVMFTRMRIKWEEPNKMGSPIECMGRPCPPSAGNQEGIACQLNNGGPCLHPGLNDEDPCMLIYNFPVVLHDHPEFPVVLSMKSTGIKVARNFITIMKIMRLKGQSVPPYAQQFEFDTVQQKNAQGTFYNFAFTRVEGWPPESISRLAKSTYESLKNVSFIAHDDNVDREPGSDDM